jgi:hypothetical protein
LSGLVSGVSVLLLVLSVESVKTLGLALARLDETFVVEGFESRDGVEMLVGRLDRGVCNESRMRARRQR